MSFDKTKVSLFLATIFLFFTTILFGGLYFKEKKSVRAIEKVTSNSQIANQSKKEQEIEGSQATDEEIIKTFYQTLYNYQKSPQEVDVETVKKVTNDTVFKDLQNERTVNTANASRQQNVRQGASLKEEDIKILSYHSEKDINQYLVTVPLIQTYNDTKTEGELQQIIQLKDGQIINQQAIQLPE